MSDNGHSAEQQPQNPGPEILTYHDKLGKLLAKTIPTLVAAHKSNPDMARQLRLAQLLAFIGGITSCEGMAQHLSCYQAALARAFLMAALAIFMPVDFEALYNEVKPTLAAVTQAHGIQVDWDSLEK